MAEQVVDSCQALDVSPQIYLSVLGEISRLISQRVGQQQMLGEVLHLLAIRLGMTHGTILLLSADGAELTIEEAPQVDSNVKQNVRYRLGEGVVGHVVETGKPVVVPCLATEARFRNRIFSRDQARLENTSFICVPINPGDEVVGTLAVDMQHQPAENLAQAARWLEIVANMIAYDVKSRRASRLQHSLLEGENLRLREALGEHFRNQGILGNSRAMREVSQKVHQVAASDATVLIRGESGTGKELVASAIHFASKRAKGPFVKVNCAAFSETLLESELFGHERGAFTGAIHERIGPIEQASGGTLFLDEIGEFSLSLQIKLLRVLQEREFQRVGSSTALKADVRIIAATNRNLEEALRQGSFRLDLFYRIAVFPVFLPSLRERMDDILLLADHFAAKYSARCGKPIRRISTPAINLMMSYHWPGNVRELENCIEHGVILSTDGVIHSHHLPSTLQKPVDDETATMGALDIRVSALERDMIADALKRTDGSVNASAAALGITIRVMRYKMKKLRICFPSSCRLCGGGKATSCCWRGARPQNTPRDAADTPACLR